MHSIFSLRIISVLVYSAFALTVHAQSPMDRLASCDSRVALQAAQEVLDSSASQDEPLIMFRPAAVLFEHGKKDDALFWFYAAQLRTRYQLVFEKGDRGQLLQVMLMTVGMSINNFGFSDTSRMKQTIERVLVWDKATPNPFRDRQQTAEQQAQIRKIYEGLDELLKKLASEGPALERQARESAPMILGKHQNAVCKQGAAASRTRP